ncbi:MAG: hypothetical protein ACYSU0_19310 [Planctomycetota bacterium]
MDLSEYVLPEIWDGDLELQLETEGLRSAVIPATTDHFRHIQRTSNTGMERASDD